MMTNKVFRRGQAVFPAKCFDSYKILGKLNALSVLSSLLEIPGLFSLVFKIVNCRRGKEVLSFFFKPLHCYASMLNFNVSKLKPNKKPEYLESTTKSLRYFLLQLSGQVIFCVCLSLPNFNM